MAQLMVAAMRLCLTADRDELVAEDDPRAAFLYASVGDEIPQSAVEKFGLVEGKLPVVDADAVAAEAQRKADEAAAEARRLADEAAVEAKRKADEEAAAAEKKAAEDAASQEGGAKEDGAKEDGEGATKEAKPGKTKG